jgi:hypothetical protein
MKRSRSGQNNHKYRSDKTDEEREAGRAFPEYREWVRAVMGLHQYTCAISGQRGGSLSAHHIFNWADHPELRLNTSNGVVLTRDLHKEFHQLYGKGNNTLEQFQEFFYIKTGNNYKG